MSAQICHSPKTPPKIIIIKDDRRLNYYRFKIFIFLLFVVLLLQSFLGRLHFKSTHFYTRFRCAVSLRVFRLSLWARWTYQTTATTQKTIFPIVSNKIINTRNISTNIQRLYAFNRRGRRRRNAPVSCVFIIIWRSSFFLCLLLP